MWRRLMLPVTAFWVLTACDMNLYELVVKPKTDRALMEEARIKIDEQDYAGALPSRDPGGRDSKELPPPPSPGRGAPRLACGRDQADAR